MTYEEQLQTLVEKSQGLSDLTWEELVDELGLDISPTTLRKSWNSFFGGYAVLKYLEENTIEPNQSLKDDIYKERLKLQRINREHIQLVRADADKELFSELIVDAIKNMKSIEIKPSHYNPVAKDTERTSVINVADAHYGKSFELKGLFGEVVNKYSPEIFKARMWELLDRIEKSRDDVDFDRLKIIDLGDCIDGILRTGTSLRKLQVGVMDSVLEYSEFMANWICECWNRLGVPVEYSLTGGNHDLVRLLSNKKDFDDENIAKLIHGFIDLRIKLVKAENKANADCLTVKPYDDAIYHNIYGINIMSYHGDSKDMKTDIEFFENFYNIQIDMLLAGHLHRGSAEDIGISDVGDRSLIRMPSICGTDDFAKSIRKSSRPGAKYMVFDKNEGLIWERKFCL